MSGNAPEVSTLLARAVRAGLGVGWVAAALRRGETGWVWTAGKDALGGEEVTADLWYDLASLTKPLVTTPLLLLARRDGLALDTALEEVLPELTGSPWAGVTLLQCATHTAGFPAWEPLYAGGLGPEAYLSRLAGIPAAAAPGERVIYSCLSFIALGLVLERVAGEGLAALFQDLVAGPLGLDDDCGFAPPSLRRVAAGDPGWTTERALLALRGLTIAPPAAGPGTVACNDGHARGLSGAAGNAGLLGNAAAVARLAAEFLPGGGEILSAEEAALATRDWTPGKAQARGLGWLLASTPGCSAGALPGTAFGHTGFTGTSVWVEPGGTVLVVLGNRLHPHGRTPELNPLRRSFHRLGMGLVAG